MKLINHRMRFIAGSFLAGIFFAFDVMAACPLGSEVMHKQGILASLPIYEQCALNKNDDETQIYLAHLYDRGQSGVPVNIQRALLFYHLSSENGNAVAQTDFSKLLRRLDETESGRQEILRYKEKIMGQLKNKAQNSFTGEILHPYTLLLLAVEKPEEKWFYPTKIKTNSEAFQLFRKYKISPEKKVKSFAEATKWKQRKLLDMAYAVFDIDEYNSFYSQLYPKQGAVDPFARSQALQKLKERLEEIND